MTTAAAPKSDPGERVPGVETTLPDHIPLNAVVCLPSPTSSGRLTMAAVSDPVAPRITVPVLDGWSSEPGTGDVALNATGSDGMSAKVTITATDLEPGGAFLRYTADLGSSQKVVEFTVAPAQFCGYSSQLLTGTFQRAGAVDFADRITHIWTNTKTYLVVIHLEGPAGVAGFSAAKSTLMQQFAVVIP
jgi:hypothetical protein